MQAKYGAAAMNVNVVDAVICFFSGFHIFYISYSSYKIQYTHTHSHQTLYSRLASDHCGLPMRCVR